MIILHTSDWHIGKRLYERERLKEQEAALDEIADLCDREGVELVLVAGDVFDTYTPSAEAEELFYRKIKKIAGERRAVVIISGNHDDGVRLSAAAPFAGDQGVYLYGNKPRTVKTGGTRPVFVSEAGDNYAVFENRAGERVYINALPFPNEARLREERTEETYSEKIKRWISVGEAGYREELPYILLTHLFVAGGAVSESERNIDLGGARAVPLSCFPENAYVALGHLHKPQSAGGNARYSGSILQYSFDEANTQKEVVLLKTEGNRVHVVKEIPLTAGRKLVRPECNGVKEALEILKRYPQEYVELTLNLDQPLSSLETQALREACEGLVGIVAKVNTQEAGSPVRRSAMTDAELFSEYYRSQYGEDAPEEIVGLFLQFLEGI